MPVRSLARSRGLELDVCSGLFVGAVKAQAVGFTSNEQRRRSWLAIPVELSVADRSGPIGWEVSAAALGSLTHQDFRSKGWESRTARRVSEPCSRCARSACSLGSERSRKCSALVEIAHLANARADE